jgi:hypothetical protein
VCGRKRVFKKKVRKKKKEEKKKWPSRKNSNENFKFKAAFLSVCAQACECLLVCWFVGLVGWLVCSFAWGFRFWFLFLSPLPPVVTGVPAAA